MGYQNFFTTRLFAEIGAADSVITLETPPVETSGRLVLESRNPTQREIIRYTGLSGNQITGVLRGQGGTSAKPHLKNSLVEMNVTAEDLEDALGAPDNLSQYMREALSDFVVPGTGNIAKTTLLTGSFADIVYYMGGLRYEKSSIPNRAYTASRDTYVFISIAGTITYTPVANGAAAPSTPAGSILVAVVTTSATEITTVVIHNRGAVKSQNVDFATFISRGLVAKNTSTVTKATNSSPYSPVTPSVVLSAGLWALWGKIATIWPASTDGEFQVVIYNTTTSTVISTSGGGAVRGTSSGKGELRNTMALLSIADDTEVAVGWTLGGGTSSTASVLANWGELLAVKIA